MYQGRNESAAVPPRYARLLGSLRLLLAALLLGGATTALALDSSEEQTVLQALQESSDQFSTFLTMVEQAGMTENLQSEGPITVLAPTNAAFEDLDESVFGTLQSEPDQMAGLVNGLIISGAYMMEDLEAATDGSLAPLSGDVYEVEMTAGGLRVNGVGFDATDVDNVYSNGVVHVTGDVVLPPTLRAAQEAAREADQDRTDATDPATDPAADPNADPATAPLATPAVPPAQTDQPEPTTAFVRVVQLSPGSSVDVVLTPQEEGLSIIDLGGMEYGSNSGYQEIQPGSYLISSTMPDSQDALFDPPTENFDAGSYYTVAITGLQVPADTEANGEDEGFGGWLRNLFGGDGNRDALALRANTYRDDVRRDADGTDTRVRIIDAAPGSPAFDLVAINSAGERNVIANDMTYGDDSGAQSLAEDVVGLELTAADSAAVALDLGEHLPLNRDTTVFLIGTTFEGAPFDVMVLPNGPAAGDGGANDDATDTDTQ